MSEDPRTDVPHRWIPIFLNEGEDMSKPKEAPSLPAPETGWFGSHVRDQGGGIIALVAPPTDPMQPVEGVWSFTGQVLVMVRTSSPGRNKLHFAWMRAALDSVVFTAERLGEDYVEEVTAAAEYRHVETGDRWFSDATPLNDQRSGKMAATEK